MNVSNNFKNYITEHGKEISVRVKYDDTTIEKIGIKSCVKHIKGDIYKSIMQYVDLEIEGNHDVKGKDVSVDFGVSYDGSSYEYVHWGTFVIDKESIEYSVEKDTTKFTAYDYMIKSHIDYDLNLVYPITVKQLLKAICERLGYTLISETFVNSNQLIENEKYLNIGKVTFRDVLDEISGCSASTILISDDKLEVKYPKQTNYVIDEHNLKSMSILDKFGPINSVVLSREPQEDNYFKQDEESIALNALTEVRFSNNEIMDKTRENFIDEIFNKLNGTYFYPYEIEAYGFCYFDPLDMVTIKDLDGNEYQSIILNDIITVTTGLNEKISIAKPEYMTTDYSKATQDKKELYKTQIEVDKQNKKINAFIENTETSFEKLKNSISVSLSLNYVNSQTYDLKLNKYYPDYTVQPLKITPIVKDALKDEVVGSTITWKRKSQSDDDYVDLIDGETVQDDVLVVSHNLDESVEYAAYATINEFTAQASVSISLNSVGPSLEEIGGVSIDDFDMYYYLSTSSSLLIGGSWSIDRPNWGDGKYIWSKAVTTFKDGTTKESSPVCITGGIGPSGKNGTPGKDGEQGPQGIPGKDGATGLQGVPGKDGATGATGKGISSYTAEFYLSDSKETQTGGSWSASKPQWSVGKYMWIRYKIVYSNPTSTEYTTPICDSSWEVVNDVRIESCEIGTDADRFIEINNDFEPNNITLTPKMYNCNFDG